MATPPLPNNHVRYMPSSSNDSARGALDHGQEDGADQGPVVNRRQLWRHRADSTGSTRGAFITNYPDRAFQNPPASQERNYQTINNDHNAPPPPPPPPPRQTYSGLDDTFPSAIREETVRRTDGTNYESQREEIAQFSSMAHADYGSNFPRTYQQASPVIPRADKDVPPPPPPPPPQTSTEFKRPAPTSILDRIATCLDPTDWLMSDVKYDEDGVPYFDENSWSLASWVRFLLFNPEYPEFTSLQQINWAVVIGIFMGFYTAIWKWFIMTLLNFLWITIPGHLKQWGVFTDLDGPFPLPHYMWICPMLCGGFLAWVSVILPTTIPGQNEWIESLHSRGVMEWDTFWPIFFLATGGMASGLTLGPELPLILTGGMVGSYLGVICKQSILQARVLNLTAAGAAIGGFFGFPMAGALFVLELPHRMGVQYFEAISPATIASIVAVLVNRIVTGNNVTGYYKYPFLSNDLPASIFTGAILYGIVGGGLGIVYARSIMKLKSASHGVLEKKDPPPAEPKNTEETGGNQDKMETGESLPLVGSPDAKIQVPEEKGCLEKMADCTKKTFSCGIRNEPTRMAIVGCLIGLVVGMICMFLPAQLFWGEHQLQSLINKGRTPLPVFGRGNSTTADLTAYGFCLINPDNPQEYAQGYSIPCSGIMTVVKIFVTGISLGTGIIGGHFWGPLFIGVIFSHFFSDVTRILTTHIGFGNFLVAHPCVTILCFMGSAHVVAFRAHMGIMLILTLTISAFNPLNSTIGSSSGDYSAVFPLLVVSVYIAMMISRGVVFYKTQRCRGDIMALPEVLCEPGKEGAPMIVHFDDGDDDDDFDGGLGVDDDDDDDYEPFSNLDPKTTADQIEREFESQRPPHNAPSSGQGEPGAAIPVGGGGPDKQEGDHSQPKDRLDELLSQPLDSEASKQAPKKTSKWDIVKKKVYNHRRIQSASAAESRSSVTSFSTKSSESVEKAVHVRSGSGGKYDANEERLVQVSTYGELTGYQPSLMDQARRRASSLHRRLPSNPKTHSRKNSESSVPGAVAQSASFQAAWLGKEGSGNLPMDEVERAFASTSKNSQGGV